MAVEDSLAIPETQKLLIREKILAFEDKLRTIKHTMQGDCFPLKHSFADGCYVREIFIPKGHAVVGKIHKHSHPNFLMSGIVLVCTENGGIEEFEGPRAMISPAGTKRALVALTDVRWITVHVTDETDLEKIEEEVIAKDYQEYAQFVEARKALA